MKSISIRTCGIIARLHNSVICWAELVVGISNTDIKYID